MRPTQSLPSPQHAMLPSMKYSEGTPEMIAICTKHFALSTGVLTDTDKALAIRDNPQPEDTPSRAPVSNLTMSHGHIAIWPLEEVGYNHVPAYIHPDCFADIESCSWSEALQAIEEHDWSFVEQDDICQSHSENANHSENSFQTTLQSLEDLSPAFAQSDQDESTYVSAEPLHGGADHLDLELADEPQLSSPSTSEIDIASECAKLFITEMKPCSLYQSMVRETELQIAPTKDSGDESYKSAPAALVEDELFHALRTKEVQDLTLHGRAVHKGDETLDVIEDGPAHDSSIRSELVPPQAQMTVGGMHVKQILGMGSEEPANSLVETVASTEEEAFLSSESTSSPLISITRWDHAVASSSDGGINDITSPTDTAATSPAEVPSDAIKTPDEHEPFSQSGSLQNEANIEEVGIAVSPMIIPATTEELGEAVIQTQGEIKDTQMTDVKNESKGVIQPSLIVADTSVEAQTIIFSSPPGKNLPGHDITESPEEMYGKENFEQPIACVPRAESTRPSSPSTTPVSPAPEDNDLSTSIEVPKSPVIDPDTSMQDSDIEYSAIEHQRADSPLPGLQLYEANSDIDCSDLHSPANCNQHSTPLHAAAAEPTGMKTRPELPLLAPASLGFSFPQPFPAPPPSIDMASIMLALATYRSGPTVSVLDLKRPFACEYPVVDLTEGPVTKKQRSCSTVEPAVDESPGAEDVADADQSALEAVDQSLVEPMVADETREREQNSTILDAQDKTIGELTSAVIRTEAMNSVGADAEKQVHDIATLGANTPTKEASVGPADSLPSLTAVVENSIEGEVEHYKQRSPETHDGHLTSDAPSHFTGPYIQTTDVEMRERITTVSPSPPPELSISSPTSTPKPRGPRIKFRPLKPVADEEQIARTEDLDSEACSDDSDEAIQKQLAYEMDMVKPNKLSEADEASSTPALLADQRTIAVAVKTDNTPALQDLITAPNASTPAPKTQATSAPSSPPQTTDPQTTPLLLRELDLGYGRRTTRSQAHSTEQRSSPPSKQRHDELTGVAGVLESTEAGKGGREGGVSGDAKRKDDTLGIGGKSKYGFIEGVNRRMRSEAVESPPTSTSTSTSTPTSDSAAAAAAKPKTQNTSQPKTVPARNAKPAPRARNAKSAAGRKSGRTRSGGTSSSTPTAMQGGVEGGVGRRLRTPRRREGV